MKRFLLAGLAVLGLLGAGSAAAQTIQVRWSSTLYAGPSESYPAVTFLRSGESVRLNGCLQDYAWCDVSTGVNRGWVDADNLAIYRGGQSYTFYEATPWFTYPVVTFLLTDYWRHNYYSRPWYRDWNRYDRYDWRHSNRHWQHRPPPHRPPHVGRPGFDHRPPHVDRPGFDGRPGPRPPHVDRPGPRPPFDHRPGNPGPRPPFDRPGQGPRPPFQHGPNPGFRPNDRPGQPSLNQRPPSSPIRTNGPPSRPMPSNNGPRPGGPGPGARPNGPPRQYQQER